MTSARAESTSILPPAAGQRDQQRHREGGGRRRARQQRPPDGEGDGDAGEHGVLHGLGDERQAPQGHVDPDDRPQRAEQEDLDQRPAHEPEPVGIEEEGPQVVVTMVLPPASTTALRP